MRKLFINGERGFISSLRQHLADSGSGDRKRFRRARDAGASSFPAVSLGIGDDCAILHPPFGNEILVTTDFTLETVHFRREWHPAESVGHRCMARGLSDLAAMGANPLAAFLSLALPAELVRDDAGQASWRERFFDGFLSLAEKYKVPLAGGDMAQSPLAAAPPFQRNRRNQSRKTATGVALMDIVLIGTAPRGRSLRRSTAKAGDRIYVTGSLGGAAAELEQLSTHPRRFRNAMAAIEEAGMPNPHPQMFPEPRLAIGTWLLKNRRASSAIDISDGLSTDIDHLCEESNLAATIHASCIPIHPIAQRVAKSDCDKALNFALHGGEDYELLFTASQKTHIPSRIAGVPVTCIGEMRKQKPRVSRVQIVEVVNGRSHTRTLPPGGWEHFT